MPAHARLRLSSLGVTTSWSQWAPSAIFGCAMRVRLGRRRGTVCVVGLVLLACGSRSELAGQWGSGTAGTLSGGASSGGGAEDGQSGGAVCLGREWPLDPPSLCRGQLSLKPCLEPPACVEPYFPVLLPSGDAVCLCPSGRWGRTCERQTVRIELGERHACALLDDGQMRCWGRNEFGQALSPSGAFSHVALGNSHTIALDDSARLSCFGSNSAGQCDAPPGRYMAVAAGEDFSCALHEDHRLFCFGGPFDAGSPTIEGAYLEVVARAGHACALRTDGIVVCFGEDELATRTPPRGPYTTLATGEHHACARRLGGRLECWGQNLLGEASEPEQSFVSLALGTTHSCGVFESGEAGCWGSSEGDRTFSPEGKFVSLSANAGHSCGVRPNGEVECWGGGTPTSLPPMAPYQAMAMGSALCVQPVDGPVRCLDTVLQPKLPGPFVELGQGGDSLCGQQRDGFLVCERFDGTRGPNLGTLSAFDVGDFAVCGVDPRGALHCQAPLGADLEVPFGDYFDVSVGADGACGLNSSCQSSCIGAAELPPRFQASRFVAIDLTEGGGCGILLEGGVQCWGRLDSLMNTSWPAWSRIAVNADSVCGLTRQGHLSCRGALELAALEDGFSYSGVVMRDGGVCALRNDGRLSCFGAYFIPAPD